MIESIETGDLEPSDRIVAFEGGDLRERVRRAPPHWADETIRPWDEIAFRRLEPFTTSIYWTDQGSINIYRVVGTQHPDYQGRPWQGFLEGGKRMELNLALFKRNPAYYLQTDRRRPSMYYLSTNGTDWYVAADGNHRTCIARFAFHDAGLTMLHGVHLNDYRFDHELSQLTARLREVALEADPMIQVEVVNEKTGREDTAGWKLDHFRPRVRYIDHEHGRDEQLDAIGVRRTIGELRERSRGPRGPLSGLRAWMGKS